MQKQNPRDFSNIVVELLPNVLVSGILTIVFLSGVKSSCDQSKVSMACGIELILAGMSGYATLQALQEVQKSVTGLLGLNHFDSGE